MATTSLTGTPDAVTRATARVPEAFYRGVDGQAVRQKTDPEVIGGNGGGTRGRRECEPSAVPIPGRKGRKP